ncbi:MAG: LD-carboxypeptidase [Gemmatimonadaceae bacterium]|nr:LD-carboxypeptidase [Gemmatimonadaceae bacterium]
MTPITPRSLVAPPRLGVGARVALVSPSGPLRDVTELVRAEGHARLLGWETVVGPHAMAREGYFAGHDAQRLADLSAAIADPSIDGIWCLRGGYGAARLLPALDIDVIAARPKALIGFSDITALHAIWQQAGVMSFHGPTARGVLSPFSLDSFMRAMVQGVDSAGGSTGATVIRDGVTTGRLAGGNLALVASLCGTPWAIDFTDAIVVLEDINEATYRVDRMLTQLRQAGAFNRCAGLAFGHFTNADSPNDDGARPLDDVIRECADALAVPALLGIPVGHIDDQWTLPLGALATLDATNRALRVHRAAAN